MSGLGPERHSAVLPVETARLADAVRDADLTRRVPTCPGWTLAQLVGHVGQVHRWAAALVAERASGPREAGEPDDLAVPEGAQQRSAWLREGAARLVDAVREAGVETTVWSWADEQTAGFWLRRMVHDTAVHRADAELAVGRPFQISAELAADGISEWLELLSSAKLAAGSPAIGKLRGHGQTLHFHATDDGLGETGEWMVRRTPSGVVWEHGHRKGDVALRGPAAELLLVITHRLPVTDPRIQVLGDEQLIATWLELTAFMRAEFGLAGSPP